MRKFLLASLLLVSIPAAAATQLNGNATIVDQCASSSAAKFGSPGYIIEWNKRFENKQNLLRQGTAATVVPPHGFAPHQPATQSQLAGDYFNEEISHGASRWTHMPLRVCIEGSGAAAKIFSQSLDEWTRTSNGRISFVQVQDPGEADITVDWVNGSPHAGEAGNTRSTFSNLGGELAITHAHIDIAGLVAGRPMSDSEMRKTCLHELGHALGMVHTSNPCDIMYFQSNQGQAAALNARDARTIQRLYSTVI